MSSLQNSIPTHSHSTDKADKFLREKQHIEELHLKFQS